jgi:hypothetical protein
MNTSDNNSFKQIPIQELKNRKTEILNSFPAMDQVIRGSLITRYIKCGNANCRCAKGTGHMSFYLSSFYKGHTSMNYVPKALEPSIREGIESFRLLEELLSELAELNLELFRRRGKE